MEIWKKTNEFRWAIINTPIMEDYGDGSCGSTTVKQKKVLQQMWQSNNGEQEWKELEVFNIYE